MSYSLSILDKSPIPPGATAADALANTVALAKLAEQLGYYRFWVAEHHSTPLLASSAPEVLISHILAHTAASAWAWRRDVAALAPTKWRKPSICWRRWRQAGWIWAWARPRRPAVQHPRLAALSRCRPQARFHRPADRAECLPERGRPEGIRWPVPRPHRLPPITPGRFLLGGSPDSARLAAPLGGISPMPPLQRRR
jgi:alkanesulfonate monooxygenase SsuD/methylene tetrahydromethanopterin reductase-like flavin-dependent oxidoreductase (luciferase family)